LLVAKEPEEGAGADAALTVAKAAFTKAPVELHRDFDSPPYPELVRRSKTTGKDKPLGRSTVGDWFTGKHFPSPDATVTLVRAITGEDNSGAHVADFRERRRRITQLEEDRKRGLGPQRDQAEPEVPDPDGRDAVRRRSPRRWWIAVAAMLAIVAAIAVYVATRPDRPARWWGSRSPQASAR
jgi:hypothetical protein